MAKGKMMVRYRGSGSYYTCDCPKGKLVYDAEYEIVKVFDRGYRTDYVLKGLEDYCFDSGWFEIVSTKASKKTYLAESYKFPQIGEAYVCCRLETDPYGKKRLMKYYTSDVQEVEKIETDIYKVTTMNSVYIVKVLS